MLLYRCWLPLSATKSEELVDNFSKRLPMATRRPLLSRHERSRIWSFLNSFGWPFLLSKQDILYFQTDEERLWLHPFFKPKFPLSATKLNALASILSEVDARPHLLQLFSRMLHRCFTVMLQKCLVLTFHQHGGWGDDDCIFIFMVNLSFKFRFAVGTENIYILQSSSFRLCIDLIQHSEAQTFDCRNKKTNAVLTRGRTLNEYSYSVFHAAVILNQRSTHIFMLTGCRHCAFNLSLISDILNASSYPY